MNNIFFTLFSVLIFCKDKKKANYLWFIKEYRYIAKYKILINMIKGVTNVPFLRHIK